MQYANDVLELLTEFLGEPDKRINQFQFGFSCPACSRDKGVDKDHKGNLEINTKNLIYNCWACSEYYDTKGTLSKLIKDYSNSELLRKYNILTEGVKKQRTKDDIIEKELIFPKDYIKISDGSQYSIARRQALNYLRSRNITEEMCERHNIGYCEKGIYTGRVIVPSFDSKGKLNYFISRTYSGQIPKYKNPKADKEKIIFNESLIDWSKPVTLVEGVFDMFFIDNSIPLLGKKLYELLHELLYEKAIHINICLDGDAWVNAKKIYATLNGGNLYGKVDIFKLPNNKDTCDLKGDVWDYKTTDLKWN